MPAPQRAGPYWFIAALGRGGMADIYLVATKSAVGVSRLNVLKRPRVDFLDDDVLRSMFLDEGRLATRLEHANIVRTHEVAIYDNQPYIAMEFVDGLSLHRLLFEQRDGRVTVDAQTWMSIITEVLDALEYAHQLRDFDGSPLSIIHRDVSPGNVLLSYNGVVKLCDFGVAKAALHSSRTEAGTVKGKAAHVAPECLAGDPIDQRADVYSVGVLLYKCIVGRGPWRTALNAAERDRPPRMSERVPDVSPELDDIVAKALAPHPRDRFASALEMRQALEGCFDGRAVRASRRNLVNTLGELMAPEREALTTLIRSRLAEIENAVPATASTTLPRLVVNQSVPPEPTSVSLRPGIGPKPSRNYWVAVALALGAGVATAAALVGRESGSSPGAAASQTTATVEPTGVDPLPPPVSTASSSAEEAVEIYIVVAPRDASIEVDGRPRHPNPVALEVPIDGSEHVIVATAPGYASQRVVVRFDRDRDINIKLEPLPLEQDLRAPGAPSSPPVVPSNPGAPPTAAPDESW